MAALLLAAAPALAEGPAVPQAATPARHQSAEDLAAIRAVLDRFMEAIARKDARALSALVLHSRITFTTIEPQAAVDEVRRFDAHFDGVGQGGFTRFARYVATSKERLEERFSNVEIALDGPLASVTFDYVFLEDGKASNHGLEHWLLRKVDGAWRIFSVVWTVNEGGPG